MIQLLELKVVRLEKYSGQRQVVFISSQKYFILFFKIHLYDYIYIYI